MNKRGIALVFGLLVTVVLFILIGAFFLKSINENNLVKRYLYSTRALWFAEAGVAKSIERLSSSPNIDPSGTYNATTAHRTTINATQYYDIISTGSVALPSGGVISRTVKAIVRTGSVDANKFQYAIAAANDLCFGGASCNRSPEDFLDPNTATGCNSHACSNDGDDTINFTDLFGYEQNAVEQIATHYTDTNFPGNVSGINWIDVAPGSTAMIDSSLEGSGVLIINGNVHFGGDYTFRGIVYVLGTLEARGTFDAWGSVIVASTAGIDSINGTPTFHWSQPDISDALTLLSNSFPHIVSWKEAE